MNPIIPRIFPVTALLATFASFSPLQAEVTLDPGAKDLQKIEVTDSMIGFRDTLRFYVFEKENAILRVQIGNQNTEFPITAKLFVFPKDTTAEGLAKWVNNQHSDGLYVDPAEPTATHEIPVTTYKVKSHELGKVEERPNGKSARYTVVFEFKDIPAFGEIKIKDFTDTANVLVKVQAG